MQTKLGSFIESLFNTMSGFLLALIVQKVYFNFNHISTTFRQDFMLVVAMTVVSIGRSYFVRRMWNNKWWNDVTQVTIVVLFLLWMIVISSFAYGVM